MRYIALAYHYIIWHYSRAYKNIVTVSTNFLWFIYYFFSIGTLFVTLFSPWRRIHERYKKNSGASRFLSSLFINTMMRLVGAIIKIIIISVGIVILVIVFVGGITFLALWTMLPIILIPSLIRGIALI